MRRLRKGFEYLFRDFRYVDGFGILMDYDAYWKAKLLAPADDDGQRIESYKRNLIATLIEPGSRVLDVGCGDGSLLEHLMRTRSVVPFGLEVSSKACELAREKGVNVVEVDISKPDLSLPQVDYVVISQVLEHLPNPELLLSQIKGRVTKALLVDIPNTGVISDRLRLLFGRFPKQWLFHAGEHLRFWTVRDFFALAAQLGYIVSRYHGLFDPYFHLPGIRLWRIWPGLFARYILYILRPSN